MPKRVLDGEALWRSDKLSGVDPESLRAEYAWLIPLAMANGVFECNPRLVWSRCYSYNRPDWSEQRVTALLDELERKQLLFRWNDGDGKTWGYWIGIDKPGRLPAQSRRGKNEQIGPEPPKELLEKAIRANGNIMDSNGIHKLPGLESRKETNGNQKLLGSGLGLGLGLGKTFSSDSKEVRLSQLLFTKIKCWHTKFKDPDIQKWAMDIDLMIRIDQRTEQEVEEVIIACQRDPFWRRNILSTRKLRTQFNQLWAKLCTTDHHAPEKRQSIAPRATLIYPKRNVNPRELNRWNLVMGALKNLVDPQNFDTWLKPSYLVSIQKQTATVCLPSQVFVEFWDENLGMSLSEALDASESGINRVEWVTPVEREVKSA